MSTTYHLECDECKRSLWIGQSSYGTKFYAYTEEGHLETLEQFLIEHANKPIVFRSSGHSRLMAGEEHWQEYGDKQ